MILHEFVDLSSLYVPILHKPGILEQFGQSDSKTWFFKT